MTLEDILNFIRHSNCITISHKEGGYRILVHVAEDAKWNSPHISVDVTDYDLPTRKLSAKVEYRKEPVFSTEKKREVETLKKVTHDRYHTLEKNRESELKKDFNRILKDLKKS